MGVCVSMPTCIAQFTTCSLRLAKMIEKGGGSGGDVGGGGGEGEGRWGGGVRGGGCGGRDTEGCKREL